MRPSVGCLPDTIGHVIGDPAGPLSGCASVRVLAAGVDAAKLQDIANWGIRHCPVCDALERAVPVAIEIAIA